MEHVALILMLVATSWQAIHVVLGGKVVNPNKRILTIQESIWVGSGIASLFLFINAVTWWPQFALGNGMNVGLKRITEIFVIAIFWTAFFNLFIQYANQRSKELAPVSYVAPYQGMTPFLISFAFIVFKESLSAVAWTGIGIIAFTTYVHGRDDMPLRIPRSYQEVKQWGLPLTLAWRLPKNYRELAAPDRAKAENMRQGVRWAILAAVLGTFGLMGDGLLARHGDAVLGLSAKWGLVTIFYAFVYPYWRRMRGIEANPTILFEPLRRRIAGNWKTVLTYGVSLALLEVLVAIAFRVAPVAHIGSMKRFHIVLVAILAWVLLGEKKKRRIATAIGFGVGTFLLGLDPHAQAHTLNTAEEYLLAIREFFSR